MNLLLQLYVHLRFVVYDENIREYSGIQSEKARTLKTDEFQQWFIWTSLIGHCIPELNRIVCDSLKCTTF